MVEKWADSLISAVRYNEANTHIVKVRSHTDNGDSVGSGSEVTRTDVVALLEVRHTFSTIVANKDGKWDRGAAVGIVTVEGQKYIRTDADNRAADNLGDLPRF